MYKLITLLFISFAYLTTLPAKANDHTVLASESIEWGLLNPLRGQASPKAADLWGDRTKDMATGMLVKFKKGFASPPHIHNVTYRGVVIKGAMHNDDPAAEKLWLSPGSFWTQPAGENHVTAADGENNLIYLEIDSGPYLVLPANRAFDNGELPINVDQSNLVWLETNDVKWLPTNAAQIAYLWGNTRLANGSFVKLPAGFKGILKNEHELKAVVVSGEATYQWENEKLKTRLSPSSFFSSKSNGNHKINTESELILYINSIGSFTLK